MVEIGNWRQLYAKQRERICVEWQNIKRWSREIWFRCAAKKKIVANKHKNASSEMKKCQLKLVSVNVFFGICIRIRICNCIRWQQFVIKLKAKIVVWKARISACMKISLSNIQTQIVKGSQACFWLQHTTKRHKIITFSAFALCSKATKKNCLFYSCTLPPFFECGCALQIHLRMHLQKYAIEFGQEKIMENASFLDSKMTLYFANNKPVILRWFSILLWLNFSSGLLKVWKAAEKKW